MTAVQLRETIAAHPLRALAIAFAAGAFLAIEQPRAPRTALGRSLFATVGGIAFGIARDLATRRAFGAARAWFDDEVARAHVS